MQTTITRAAALPMTTAADGARLAREQRSAFADVAAHLTPQQWRAPSGCPRWTVFDLAAHVASQAENQAHPLTKTVPGIVRGKLRYRRDSALDAMNEFGIDARRDTAPEQLLHDLRRLAAEGTTPPWFRRVPLGRMMGLPAYTTGAYLGHVIYVRDVWMHRVELARAIDAPDPDEPSTAEIVTQVIRDLGKQWKGPDLLLTLIRGHGASGGDTSASGFGSSGTRELGTWLLGTGPATPSTPVAELPAVEFMLHLSGREIDPAMFNGVPDAMRTWLANARVAF